eukprot:15167460-Alexandrium_andersonii.AAC.1
MSVRARFQACPAPRTIAHAQVFVCAATHVNNVLKSMCTVCPRRLVVNAWCGFFAQEYITEAKCPPTVLASPKQLPGF